MPSATNNPCVIAIRGDFAVGYDSCSVIDECYDDEELDECLTREGISDPVDAVRWARECDLDHSERGLNCCSGEPETDRRLRAPYYRALSALMAPIRA
jgi:hypothetical protein